MNFSDCATNRLTVASRQGSLSAYASKNISDFMHLEIKWSIVCLSFSHQGFDVNIEHFVKTQFCCLILDLFQILEDMTEMITQR